MSRQAFPVVGLVLATLLWARPGAADDYLEAMLGQAETEGDYNDFLNLLDTALRSPVNLLEADPAEIGALPWMSPWLADSVLALRARGELRSVDDLGRIEGTDPRLLDLLRPLVVVKPVEKTLPPLSGHLRLRVVASPPAAGYEALKTYALLKLETRGLAAGGLVEKDAGETQVNDFQAFYLEKTWAGGEVVAGDFTMTSGHGLVLSNPYRQSPSTVDPWRFSRGTFGVRPATSVEENFALRGAGLEVSSGELDFCLGVSRTRRDAALDENGAVISVDRPGTHVTPAETRGRDALGEDLLAAAARLRLGSTDLTLSLVGERLDRELTVGRVRRSRDAVRLAGGVDVTVRSAETLVFAEGAVTEGGAGAAAGGLAFEVSSAEVLVLGRAYGDRYLSLHARPFGYYSGTVSGERGLFTGLTLKSSKAHLALGNDVHSRSRLGGAGSRPSGSQTFAELGLSAGDFTLTLAEKFTVGEEPPEDADAPAGLACGETGAGQRAALVALAPGRAGDGTEETRRLRSRLDLQYRASGRLRVRVRYESLSARESLGRAETRSASDLLRFDAAVDRLGPLSVDAGFQVFTVEDYAARLYQYEIGLPYYPSLVLLKADGSRWYGVVKLDLERLGSIAAKYGVTIYDDGEEDSGLLASYSARF